MKEGKARRGYKLSVKYCKKFLDRDPLQITEREKTLINANLKSIWKFENNHPSLPKCSLEKEFNSRQEAESSWGQTFGRGKAVSNNIPVVGITATAPLQQLPQKWKI